MKTGIKRTLIIIGAVVVIALVIVAALIRDDDATSYQTVAYYSVKTDSLTETISATGTFVPESSTTVYAKVTGAIVRTLVSEGDRVSAGDPLLEIDSEDYLSNLQAKEIALDATRRAAVQNLLNLRAAYSNALLAHSQAEKAVMNSRQLFEAGGISEEALKQAEDALTTADLSRRSAKERFNLTVGIPLDAEPVMDSSNDDALIASLPDVVQAGLVVENARKSLADCFPKAPISGTVTTIVVGTGDMAAPNTPLMKIEALDRMLAEIQIDEVDIGKLEVGDTAEITTDSLLGDILIGKVKSIAPVIQRVGNTRVTKVEISIEAAGNTLKSGASCTARIAVVAKENALVIPLTSYSLKSGENVVYRLVPIDGKDGVFEMKETAVTIGMSTVRFVEIVSGLEAGELIAVGNQSLFRDGIQCVLGEER